MATVVPLPNPSYQNAIAAGIAVGDTVVVTFQIPILYRFESVQRQLLLTAMGLSNFTVQNTNNDISQTLPWSQFYGYLEST
jgi:hypothetical protein